MLRYEFDHIFDTKTTQDEVFRLLAQDKIHDVLDGINSTIFAYGIDIMSSYVFFFMCMIVPLIILIINCFIFS